MGQPPSETADDAADAGDRTGSSRLEDASGAVMALGPGGAGDKAQMGGRKLHGLDYRPSNTLLSRLLLCLYLVYA